MSSIAKHLAPLSDYACVDSAGQQFSLTVRQMRDCAMASMLVNEYVPKQKQTAVPEAKVRIFPSELIAIPVDKPVGIEKDRPGSIDAEFKELKASVRFPIKLKHEPPVTGMEARGDQG